MSTNIFTSFTLPSGAVLKNRLVKAAMEENLAIGNQLPGEELLQLYRIWAEGGVGLIITGNVMIDHLAMTGPGGVVLEKGTDLASFRRLAQAGQQNNTKIWMQLNHPGRQVYKKMGGKVLSPSDVALDMGIHSGLFGQPKAMTESEIQEVIQRFADSARNAQQAGFNGVQIHAAHGYLLAQFLSPLTNKRTDQWGGSLENRARLLLDVIRAVRTACTQDFAVAVKLNSADFQRGGFDVDDAEIVVQMLSSLAVDMVELSGGSYEVPAMQGHAADNRTLSREAYFLEFAQQIAHTSCIPIMTTGGVRRSVIAEKVIASGVALVGIASALSSTPDLANVWHKQPDYIGHVPVVRWKDKSLSGLATMAMVKRNLRRLADGKSAVKNLSPLWSLITDQLRSATLTKRYRKQFQDEVS